MGDVGDVGDVGDAVGGRIDEIVVDAYGEYEQLWSFRHVFEDEAQLPSLSLLDVDPIGPLTAETRLLLDAYRRWSGANSHDVPG